ncbi:hypothetical protein D6C90_01629 [Aureobasidium pullulans]|uniref:Ubiquitin 3 binding protein But2 C-terminal domain-containing protein n=1 Tax=Aureobasidium pullulans TaxID=5580 RepID=A0A4S9VJI5_AURPU|nr:hypothetical protein D6C90_01629 [Aureobasidium pullulans]
MYSSSWACLFVSLLAASASALPKGGGGGAAAPAAAAGPASAKVIVYSSYTCVAPNTVRYKTSSPTPSKDVLLTILKLPPTDGSAGTATTFTITEGQCTIPTVGLSFDGAITATLTATPKAGTLGCYVLGHSQQGCGITLTNTLTGFPFGGTAVGSSVGCGNPPSGTSWNAFEVLCQ